MARYGRAGLIAALMAFLAAVAGLVLSSRIQAGAGVNVEEVTFTGASGARMRALLFRPDTATPQRPAPGILAFHGYLNSAEMQGNFAAEFARRGYVVLAPDQRGHGGSDPAAFADGFGGPDALTYLRGLPFVDRTNVGLEGHSMGGWAVLSAAKAHPNGYKSLILEGSSVGAPFAPEGTIAFPRNLLVVYGTRDEFGGVMWGPEAPLATGATQKMRALFGSNGPVQPRRLYGSIADGTARMLLTPDVTHPWLHQSSKGITPALDWFARTLEGARGIPSNDRIWPLREAGGLIGLIAVPLLIAGLMAAAMPIFPAARVEAAPDERAGSAGKGRRVAELGAIAIVPALLFIPACMAVEALLGQNWLFRQTFTNQFVGWAVLITLLSLLILRRMGVAAEVAQLGRAVPVALIALVPAFALVAGADRLLHVNPSWWFLTIRPLSIDRVRDFILYAPFFVASCLTSLRLIDAIDPLDRGSFGRALGRSMAALSGGFLLFLLAQYAVLAMTGHLLLPSEGLRVIQAIGFAFFLLFVALFGTVSRRLSGSVASGGLVSGLFITWILTATQPIGA